MLVRKERRQSTFSASRTHPSLDIQGDDENAIGISFKGARVGDQITLVTDFSIDEKSEVVRSKKLHFWISLVDGRTELEWMDNLVGEMDAPYQCDDWHNLVQVKGGSSTNPVVIEVVTVQYELPQVEW